MCWQSSHHPHAVSMIGTGEHSFSPCRPAGCIRLWRTPTALHGQREQQTYQTFDLAMCGYVLVSPIWHWQSAQHFCTNRRCQLQQLAGITTFTCLTMATGMMYLLYQAGGTRMGAKAGLGLSVSPPVGCRRNVPPLRLAFVSTQQIRSTKRTATERCWHPSARSASTLPQHCVVHFVMLFYPNKPFFKQATQQQIMAMRAHAIREETQTLEFPGKLSEEGKAFLKRALAPRREERPDVVELLADPYMVKAGK